MDQCIDPSLGLKDCMCMSGEMYGGTAKRKREKKKERRERKSEEW